MHSESRFGFTWQIVYNTSLLFVYIVCGPVLHVLVIYCQDDICLETFCCYRCLS